MGKVETKDRVLLVTPEWVVLIDKIKAREILQEPDAVFPEMFCVSKDDPFWVDRGGAGWSGVFFPLERDGSGKLTRSAICFKHNTHRRTHSLRNTVIHELRHWWQHATTERLDAVETRESPSIQKSKRRPLWFGGGVFLVTLLLFFVAMLAERAPSFLYTIPVLCLPLSIVLIIIFTKFMDSLDVYTASEFKNSREHDAYGYTARHGEDPAWQEAVLIMPTSDLLAASSPRAQAALTSLFKNDP